MGFRVWGLGFRVWGLGFRVSVLGFPIWGLGFRFRVWGLGFTVQWHLEKPMALSHTRSPAPKAPGPPWLVEAECRADQGQGANHEYRSPEQLPIIFWGRRIKNHSRICPKTLFSSLRPRHYPLHGRRSRAWGLSQGSITQRSKPNFCSPGALCIPSAPWCRETAPMAAVAPMRCAGARSRPRAQMRL